VLDLHPDAELVGIGVSAEMIAAESADVAAADPRVSCRQQGGSKAVCPSQRLVRRGLEAADVG
jgi:hypothetical protein